jgi:hypothetical protein
MNKLSKLNDLDWLVEARNKIQALMLDIYKIELPIEGQKGQLHLLIGAAFSLWRAVFLVDTSNRKRESNELHKDAKDFLRKVIETNSILFGDDIKFRNWSSGYYVNNARYRLGEVFDERVEVGSTDVLKHSWENTFATLQKAVGKIKGDNDRKFKLAH